MARILLDVDGVLADLVSQLLCEGAQKRPDLIHTEYDDITQCKFENAISDPVLLRLYNGLLRAPGIVARMRPITGSVSGVNTLRRMKHDIRFVTAPFYDNNTWVPDRVAWLETFYGAKREDIVFADAKYLVRGDLLVDDFHGHYNAFTEVNGDGSAVMYEQPWNKNVPGAHVANWDELVLLVKRLFPPTEV